MQRNVNFEVLALFTYYFIFQNQREKQEEIEILDKYFKQSPCQVSCQYFSGTSLIGQLRV